MESQSLSSMWENKLLQKPQILGWQDFRKLDEEIMFRGIPSFASIDSELEGTHLPNYEIYGPGLYFSYSMHEAVQYTQKNGTLIKAKLSQDANVVIDGTVDWLEEGWYGYEQVPCFYGKTDVERFLIAKEYITKGIDVYITAGGYHVAILNRSKLIIKNPYE